MADSWKNKLYYGDNLESVREHIPDESVDLLRGIRGRNG
jgi:site-specific DNA-methyltransferase (adenine-specific)